ncbi:hypothetical protein HBI56_171660 [Parastagonospora nodorum]|nr:hypothetical protein HBH52_244520 [Parastagonospora nodorum]KAH3995144.1 hypothetical protein HBI10_175510 [Parastagonospora nodorum]KAH4017514.1 hypothetical protein HBI13_141060 [Parastagonospora nodorum]KAH4112540.1 hypothetical protein HBH47_224600 [Parastagonospora nodorum]KAH4201896.1 hypothetical protein HBI95_164690 [Parastagonospora nodorum]
MQYLIDVPGFTHPYLTTLAFIAHDFRKRGHRVSEHAFDSRYIIEVRFQERKRKLATSRPSMTEMWAKQFMSQRAGYSAIPTVLSQEDTRLDRMSRMIEDFFRNIAAIGRSVPITKIRWWSPTYLRLARTPLPDDPGLNLVLLCIQLLHSVRYTQNALVLASRWTIVDSVILQFRHDQRMDTAHLKHALKQVGAVPGRLSGIWGRDETTGMEQVQMFVNVGDCVTVVGNEGESTGQLLPLYAPGEQPPVYEVYEGQN